MEVVGNDAYSTSGNSMNHPRSALELPSIARLPSSSSSVENPLTSTFAITTDAAVAERDGTSAEGNIGYDVFPAQTHSQAQPEHSSRTNTRVNTILLLLNSMIGSGVFNMPHVFASTGLISGYCLLTLSALLVYAGLVLLVLVSEREREKVVKSNQRRMSNTNNAGINVEDAAALFITDYSHLAESVFSSTPGRESDYDGYGCSSNTAGMTVDVSIFLLCLGSLLSYISAITGTVDQLLLSWGSRADLLGVTSAILIFLVFPLCLQRFYGHFAGISVVSMASVSAVLLLVLIGGPLYTQRYEGATLQSQSAPLSGKQIFRGNPLNQLGSVIFTLSCASATFHTYRYMRERDLKEWRVVAAWTVALGWLLCAVMGTAGALAFGLKTRGIILSNFTQGHVGDAFQCLFVLHLVLYIPLDFLIARHSLLRASGWPSGSLKSQWWHVLLCVLLLGAPVGLVFAGFRQGLDSGEVFSSVLNFTGGLCGSFTAFVLPAAFYLRQGRAPNEKWASVFTWLFLFVGIVIAVYVPVATILAAVER